jgi:methionyl-tRNA formyltransferase
MKILFLSKKNDIYAEQALAYLKNNVDSVDVFWGTWGDLLPKEIKSWRGDIIISYLSRWILSAEILTRASMYSINFHPAPPEYPGIGGYNFALYNLDKVYGVTCHLMNEKVDSGKIIRVVRFPIQDNDNVKSLIEKTYVHMLNLFKEFVDSLSSNDFLITDDVETWNTKKFKRTDLDNLSIIRIDMSIKEIERRIKATLYGDFKPYIILHGHKFFYEKD